MFWFPATKQNISNNNLVSTFIIYVTIYIYKQILKNKNKIFFHKVWNKNKNNIYVSMKDTLHSVVVITTPLRKIGIDNTNPFSTTLIFPKLMSAYL